MIRSDSGYWFNLNNLVSQNALCLAAVIPQCLQRECLGHDCIKGSLVYYNVLFYSSGHSGSFSY